MTYLLDKSAWVLAANQPGVARRLADEIRSGNLALCTVTALEVLYSARNAQEYDRDLDTLRTLRWYELTDQRAALAVQHHLARRGWHRTPIPDVIIAATAAEHGLTVLHYDSDYERLSEVTGADHEWVLDRGAGHSPTA